VAATENSKISERVTFEDTVSMVNELKKQIASVILGKSQEIELALTALFSRGHVLVEDLPGTGKTTLAKTISCFLGVNFTRVQFTPDLMPSDVTGMSYYNPKEGEFEFRPGPVLTNILLADEINRATPRTQSALLESMEEKQVTVDGITYNIEDPFLVLATQNPIESEGVFPLPFAQQDRFLLKIRLGYPQRCDELQIFKVHGFADKLSSLTPVLSASQVLAVQEQVKHIYMDESLAGYILDLVEATRQHEQVELALSPRASLGMLRAAKTLALLRGRDFVLPDDIKFLAIPVFSHRLKLKSAETYKVYRSEDLLQEILKETAIPERV